MSAEPFKNKIWLSSPTMHGDELKFMTEAYDTNWMSTVGENINEAEKTVCEKIGCNYAVALSSGTAALHLAMKLMGIKRGNYGSFSGFCYTYNYGCGGNVRKPSYDVCRDRFDRRYHKDYRRW